MGSKILFYSSFEITVVHLSEKMSKYSTYAGYVKLQEDEVLTAIANIKKDGEKLDFDHRLIRGASESSQKRIAAEILNRLRSTPQSIWRQVPSLPSKERRIALYYLILKAHPFLFDFHMEILLQKWRVMDKSFSKDDVLKFIEKNMDEHPEMESWSEDSKRRISRTVKLLLDQIDLINEKLKLQPVKASQRLWELFIQEGETWFLEAMLLNKQERERLISSISQ
jgi:hypothetical protein